VKWSAATLDSPSGFRAFRVLGTDAADDSGAAPAQIDAPASATSVIDEELPDATNFTYWMKAKYGAPLGVPSFPLVTVTAVNVAPVATANSYDYTGTLPAVIQGSPLDNDTDADMGPAGKSKWRLVIVNASGVPVAAPAGLTINPDGKTFSYNAASGSTSFYYKVDTGKWTDGVTKMSLDSAPALVTITVRLRGPR